MLLENEIKNVYCFLKMGKSPISDGFKAKAERADDREPWGGSVRDRGALKGPLKVSLELSGASRDGMTPEGSRFPQELPSSLPVTFCGESKAWGFLG